ncbi:MAG: chromosome segregation protein SMC [Candidatus Aminicenantes bacterium]|jgi:chromosome segregation protein
MLIKKIELQGFKSFPERTKIIFHSGITAIVGPNGTGKSNIVDALLWVLGGQRAKSLKGERSEDIIFNGNTQRSALGMADVALFLADENEELIINHRVFRSGEGEYRMGGKVVRLKDIQDALWNRSIAEKEYFVIEQGQIGLFLTSKPVEKRLLLEEAAGTAYYKTKKRQAQNKLEISELNLTRLEDIISEVSRAKNSLKRQANAAIKYRQLREKIRKLTSLHYRKKILQVEENLHDITHQYEICMSQEKEIVSLLKAEEKNLAAKRKEVWEFEQSIKDSQKNLFALRSQHSQLETDKDKEAKRTEFVQEQKKRAITNLEEVKQEKLQIAQEITEVDEEIQNTRLTFSENQKALSQADKENQVFQEKLEERGNTLESMRNEYFQKLSAHTEIKNENVRIEKEVELIVRQEEKLKEQLSNERSLLAQKTSILEQKREELQQTQESMDEKKKALSAHQEELNGILSSIDNLQNKISSLKAEAEEETHHLQALKKLEKKERDAGISEDIPGTLGILADSIESDAEHAPLIDVFWKDEAKATLVPAQDLLKTLNDKKLRGNFILLSSQKKEKIPSKIYEDPRVLGLFTSYLKPDPKIKDRIHLQEAAVVKEIESAIQLWLLHPSLNYITPQGDLLFSSGLLKLGQKTEGIFTLGLEIKKIEERLGQIEKKVKPFSLELEKNNEKKQKLEEEIEDKLTIIDQLERKIEEVEKEKKYDQTETEKIKANIEILNNEIKALSTDRESLARKKDSLSLEKLKEEENTLKEKLEKEEKEIARQQEKNEQKKKDFFELKAGLDLLDEKINNLERRLKTLKGRQENLVSKENSLEEEIQNCEKDRIRAKKTIKNISDKVKELEKERGRKEKTLVQDESLLQKQKTEQNDLEDKIEQLREESEARKEERVKREISKAESDRDLVNLEESCWQDLKKTLKEVKEEIPEEKVPDTKIEEKLAEFEDKLQKFKSVNLMAEEEYMIQKKRYDFLIQQKKDLRESIDTTREAIKKIDQESKIQFLKALTDVNRHFQDVFSILFNGGTAALSLSDESHPLDSGIEIKAQPPGKKVQTLSLLSGGEKSLTSLAFFFALFRYKPTPFCVLDEVDAALDDVNLTRFLELMKKIKEQTQFIIITHNTKTMEVADYIHGTTMAEPNITSLYSIKLEQKEEKAS